MGISLGHQTTTFLFACGLGLALGIVYECFRVCRMVFRSKSLTVFFQDITYFIIVSLATFLFFQVTLDGEIRFYVILGELFGWLFYYFSIGALVNRLMKWILLTARRTYRFIRNKVFIYAVIPIAKLNKNIKLFMRKTIHSAKNLICRIFMQKSRKKVGKTENNA